MAPAQDPVLRGVKRTSPINRTCNHMYDQINTSCQLLSASPICKTVKILPVSLQYHILLCSFNQKDSRGGPGGRVVQLKRVTTSDYSLIVDSRFRTFKCLVKPN